MTREAQLVEVIAFFRTAFAALFALALAESFKQFVADKANQATDAILHWERLMPLLSFVLLIFPFYQGTIRYFVVTYGDVRALPPHYAFAIMADSFAFMVEAALFFIMSRALAPAQWETYYGSVLALLWVDSVWGLLASAFHQTPIEWWIYLNLGFGAVVFLMLSQHGRLTNQQATTFGVLWVLLRTMLDYGLTWNFYFP